MNIKEMQKEIAKIKLKLATLAIEGRGNSIEATELLTALLTLQDSLIYQLSDGEMALRLAA